MVQWNPTLSLPKSAGSRALVFIAVAAVVIAVVGVISMPLFAKWSHRNQDEAISKLRDLGTMFELDADRNVTTVRIMNGMSFDALDHLGALPRLQHLHLPLADIGDEDLARLSAATSVEDLILSGNIRLTDEGMRHLAPLVNLKSLLLTKVPLEGPGLKHLSRLPKLEVLDVAQSKITDSQLEHVAQMPALKFLNVSATEISDEGLEHLRGMTTLENLVVIGTAVTVAGGEKLQKSLPRLQITYRL